MADTVGTLQGIILTTLLAIAVVPIAYASAFRGSSIFFDSIVRIALFEEKLTIAKLVSLSLIITSAILVAN